MTLRNPLIYFTKQLLRPLRKQQSAILQRLERVDQKIDYLILKDLKVEWEKDSAYFAKLSSIELSNHEFSLGSQNGEDGVLFTLLHGLNIKQGTAVEIGAGDNGGNCSLLTKLGAFEVNFFEQNQTLSEILSDKFPDRNSHVINEIITPDNINQHITGKIEILSIDIDSNDYWVLHELLQWPEVLIAEYNASLGLESLVVSPNVSQHDIQRLKRNQIYGMSLTALCKLANKHDMSLVYVEKSGTNAFFVRNSYKSRIETISPEEIFRNSKRSGLFQKRGLTHLSAIRDGYLIKV